MLHGSHFGIIFMHILNRKYIYGGLWVFLLLTITNLPVIIIISVWCNVNVYLEDGWNRSLAFFVLSLFCFLDYFVLPEVVNLWIGVCVFQLKKCVGGAVISTIYLYVPCKWLNDALVRTLISCLPTPTSLTSCLLVKNSLMHSQVFFLREN